MKYVSLYANSISHKHIGSLHWKMSLKLSVIILHKKKTLQQQLFLLHENRFISFMFHTYNFPGMQLHTIWNELFFNKMACLNHYIIWLVSIYSTRGPWYNPLNPPLLRFVLQDFIMLEILERTWSITNLLFIKDVANS